MPQTVVANLSTTRTEKTQHVFQQEIELRESIAETRESVRVAEQHVRVARESERVAIENAQKLIVLMANDW